MSQLQLAEGRVPGIIAFCFATFAVSWLALVRWVWVVGYETVGHRHNAEVLGGSESS